MTAPGKGSRWGAFLSSAFEGVENRLDNLLDEDQQAAQGYEQQQGMKAAPAPAARARALAITKPQTDCICCRPEA
ncbi:transcription factor TMF [Fusarium fujikuroi]|nr:transcription factor TMF [Fusarium fujikuroi]